MFGFFGKSESKLNLILGFLDFFGEMVEEGLENYNNGIMVDLEGGIEKNIKRLETKEFYTKKEIFIHIGNYYRKNKVVDITTIIKGYLFYDWFSGEMYGGKEIENLLDSIKKLKIIVESDLS